VFEWIGRESVFYLLYFSAGLARREDYPFITYYCPHCHALNKPKQSAEPVSGFNSPNTEPQKTDAGEEVKNDGISVSDSLARNIKLVKATPEIEHISEGADLEKETNHDSGFNSPNTGSPKTDDGEAVKDASISASSDSLVNNIKLVDATPESEHISERTNLGKEES